MLRTILLAALAFLISTPRASEREPGSSVVVLYNSKMPASKSLAEYYAQKREVPADHVIGLPLPEKEAITREQHSTELLEPFLKKIKELKLMTFAARKWTNTAGKVKESPLVTDSLVRYATLCYGVPVKIEQDNTIQEPNPENLPALTLRNESAIDNELALLPMHYAKLSLNGPIGSRFYKTTNVSWMHPTNGILMVSRLDGPTADIARGLVDKSLEAEKNG